MSEPPSLPSPAVDAYIRDARAFAQPILLHLRATVWRAVPGVQEAMKWSRPFFLYRGVILANMSAFTEHCSFGLWGGEMASILRLDGMGSSEAMGSFGRLTVLDDLPPAPQLEGYVRQAAELIGSGQRIKSIQRVAKPSRPAPAALPQALATALKANPAAAAAFARLSPGCRREYADWIDKAKREGTRSRRLASALEMIAEGKGRHWRYEGPRTPPSGKKPSVSTS